MNNLQMAAILMIKRQTILQQLTWMMQSPTTCRMETCLLAILSQQCRTEVMPWSTTLLFILADALDPHPDFHLSLIYCLQLFGIFVI